MPEVIDPPAAPAPVVETPAAAPVVEAPAAAASAVEAPPAAPAESAPANGAQARIQELLNKNKEYEGRLGTMGEELAAIKSKLNAPPPPDPAAARTEFLRKFEEEGPAAAYDYMNQQAQKLQEQFNATLQTTQLKELHRTVWGELGKTPEMQAAPDEFRKRIAAIDAVHPNLSKLPPEQMVQAVMGVYREWFPSSTKPGGAAPVTVAKEIATGTGGAAAAGQVGSGVVYLDDFEDAVRNATTPELQAKAKEMEAKVDQAMREGKLRRRGK